MAATSRSWAPSQALTTLLVRELGTNQARPLAGTADASRPFWAPDSTALGYFTPTELRVVDLNGAAPRLVAQLPRRDAIASSGSWSADGRILFGQIGGTGIGVVSARGGAIAEITSVSTAERRAESSLPTVASG